jgi:hypothetical protein
MRAIALASVLLAVPALARAECRASASGAHSYDVRVSPRAGRACLHIVEVYAGRACETLERSVELACNETRRMALTARGSLVSILAPRARPDWSSLRVTMPTGEPAWIRLRDLPGMANVGGTPQLDFDGTSLRVHAAGGVERIALEAIESIAERQIRERAAHRSTIDPSPRSAARE